ncbi:MAG: hypothetical protein EBV06_15135 [Planctomycetia bacterium]|nr:hypothetical protein [Planctomycetia bacterium]
MSESSQKRGVVQASQPAWKDGDDRHVIASNPTFCVEPKAGKHLTFEDFPGVGGEVFILLTPQDEPVDRLVSNTAHTMYYRISFR